MAESFLVSPMKAEYPAGAFANRVVAPTPQPSFYPPQKIKSEGGQKNKRTEG
jgi:hypothetical protein